MPARKGPSKGTGGHGKKRLEGKGPTPKAEERPGHPAQRRARSAAKRQDAPRRQPTARRDQPDRGGRGDHTDRADRADRGGRRDRRALAPDEIVVGRNAVAEALRAGTPALAVRIAAGLERDVRVDEVRTLAERRGVEVVDVSRTELDRVSGGAPHQGVLLQVPPFAYEHADDVLRRALEATEPALIVALDGVSDPHNLGAIARSAAAFGAHGLVLPERRSVGVTPSAWKASAGTLARMPVARVTNLVRALKGFAAEGLMLAGLDGDGELDLDDLELASGPLVLVVGAEGGGLSRLAAETCDVRVRIPLAGAVESLNASVAAGVALAEVSRRRRAQPPAS